MRSQVTANQPKLALTVSLARDFAEIVRQQQPEKLDAWLKQASESGFQVWKNFAASLRQDYEAVRAALLYSWSNGPTEGHVNRLKSVKREMYGRANIDLLRQRLVIA
ncbi:MAG: transposase [Anaerolineae bacterium]|nr:transposase [Anaerolineae bacterium]